MHRRRLLALLERYAASGRMRTEERPSLERLVAFVRRRSDCFERTLLEGHITGSAWLLNRRRDAVLLTHHKKLGLWLQPGGHADGDADVARVALREAREESGIADVTLLCEGVFDVDVHAIPARGAEPEHFHYDVRFLVGTSKSDQFIVSDESHDLAWVRRDAVSTYATDASVLRLADKWTV